MRIVDIDGITPPSWEAAKFQGFEHGASVSFFVVHVSPDEGPDKHRHPYEEVFIILDGNIEVIADGVTHMIQNGKIAIILANTWHEFKNRGDKAALMVNIHLVAKMIQENWT